MRRCATLKICVCSLKACEPTPSNGPRLSLGAEVPACSCTIDFRVYIPNSAVAVGINMEFPTEALVTGNCSMVSAGADSHDTATIQIARMMMPTMSDAALLALALILLAGAAAFLRRGRMGGALGA